MFARDASVRSVEIKQFISRHYVIPGFRLELNRPSFSTNTVLLRVLGQALIAINLLYI